VAEDSESCSESESSDEEGYDSDAYFNAYGAIGIHEFMIGDIARTGAYHRAIFENLPDFQDKVVCDVGAGSGILSIFAAQAGARKVGCIILPPPP
jgi:2-polyprenyl-3-methyl-5-hydroxy-6-metoxy-1,4-benzoquinol methylase